ncbi:helix-turn-helix transcriptional regulator [Mangrovibacter yixingensis]|uniref:helix-turn-helix transcriptional regulator n=1 Tax=Mangrovibacter yixingensis TaxID=1529639 RepID=UPI001CF95E9C|nr:helix-turn-helix transcriptional regulator [Mangrovibacter yixingensis]
MTNPERLGEFLRLKRNTIAPESVGLGKPLRSRTPGLRREDVAELAQISTVWYAKLERGKAERVSRQVLLGIAHAMRCDDSETRYLLQLAGYQDGAGRIETCNKLSVASKNLLEALNPVPALFCNDFYDILQVNQAFEYMVGFDVNALPVHQRNTFWLLEHHPQWQHWLDASSPEELRNCMLNASARVRAALASRVSEQEWQLRLEQLMASGPIFREVWANHRVKAKEQIVRDYRHCRAGQMRLVKQSWSNASGNISGDLQVFLPENDTDKARLQAVMALVPAVV